MLGVPSLSTGTDTTIMSRHTGTNITSTCTRCENEVVLRPSALYMTLYDNGANGFYSFFCPRCTELCDRNMDFGIAKILNEAGVRHNMVHVPLEVIERKTSPAPTISSDDIMDFHLDVEKTDFIADLAAAA